MASQPLHGLDAPTKGPIRTGAHYVASQNAGGQADGTIVSGMESAQARLAGRRGDGPPENNDV